MIQRWSLPGVLALLLAGCGSPDVEYGGEGYRGGSSFPSARLAAAPRIVKRSIAALGGVEQWKAVKRIEGNLVLEIHGKWGHPYVDKFFVKMLFEPGMVPGRVIARSLSSRELRIDLDRNGRDHAPRYFENPELQQELGRALYLYVLKFTGPWRILTYGESAMKGRRNILGNEYLRVAVHEGGYYFKPDTALLRFATSGADNPGEEGLVTEYTYGLESAGLMVPGVVEIVHIGRHVLVGEEKVLTGEISNVQFFDTYK